MSFFGVNFTDNTYQIQHYRYQKGDFLSWVVVFQGMVIAETKRQMHETLEMKEEEVAQLRSRLQQATAQKEELQEQKEKAEKSGEWNPFLNVNRNNKSLLVW